LAALIQNHLEDVQATTEEPIRAGIINAAEARFSEYGYTKTTLNEIAAEAGMSAANLYRFFENKLDIAAAVARRLLARREAALNAALQGEQATAMQLQAYILTALRFDRELQASAPHLAKMLEKLLEERKELAVAQRKARQELLTRLVQNGIDGGALTPGDAGQIAQTLRAALILFETPALHRQYPQAEIERLAQQVVTVLLQGLLMEQA
jgi:AcrR family transcriptional regulator